MSNSNEFAGLRAEVSRVKSLKRNVEAALELVRSDSEKGKIHLRVSDDAAFRRKVAEAIVKESHPAGLDGAYYADPVMGEVYFRGKNATWNPWNESVNWRIVPVGELVNQEGTDFSSEVDWKIADIPYREMVSAFLSSEGEEYERKSFQANGEIPSWVSRSDVVTFAREQREKWAELIESVEAEANEQAIAFASSEILDEIIVEPFAD